MADPTLDCRLLAASAAAYGINAPSGAFTKRQPYYDGAGFLQDPTAISAGPEDIDAALVGPTADGVVVAFRGTIPPGENLPAILDWIQDIFLAEPVARPDYPGKVHSGFARALDALWDPLLAALRRCMADQPRPLYVTGHSKGAGMVPLAVWRLRQAGMTPHGVVAFAPPHPGDDAFATAYDAAVQQTRYENYLDLVPFLPPTQSMLDVLEKVPLLGKVLHLADGWDYAPVGTLRYIEENGGVIGERPGLQLLRLAEIVEKFLTGRDRQVIDAHTLDCGHGYNRGVCGQSLCGG